MYQINFKKIINNVNIISYGLTVTCKVYITSRCMHDNYVCKYVIILKVILILPAWCAGADILYIYVYLKYSHVNMDIVYKIFVYALDRCNL